MKDIDEIRRSNLRVLENEAGSATAAANFLNMSLAQFANLRDGAKDSKTGKRRGMRKETARKIERLAGKPEGWLDVDHDGPTLTPKGWERLDATGRAQVQAFIEGLLARPTEKQNPTDDDRPLGD